MSEKLRAFVAPKKIKTFSPIECGIKVPVKCISVYDGDTVKLAFHLFNNENNDIIIYSCRLIGIDTPEMKGPTKDLATKAKLFLSDLVLDKVIEAVFHTDVNEKYGRLLVELFINDENINNKMVVGGYAKPYDGGKKL
jgi:micrococcal nuclease